MAKKKDGRVDNGNPENLLPPITSTDDPRYANLAEGRDRYNKRRQAAAKKRKEYELSLKEFKANQFEQAQERMESGEMQSPAEMLMDMIQTQTLAVNNPELTKGEQIKERELLLKLWDRYAALTGANAPSASQIDVTSTSTEEDKPEDIDAELKKFTDNVIKM